VRAVAGQFAGAALSELRNSLRIQDDIAQIYTALRDFDQACAWLEKAYEERTYILIMLKVGPRNDPLRSDPRFQDLLRRMNFPP
jgi:predicted deacetylase